MDLGTRYLQTLQTLEVGPLGQGSKDIVEQLEAFTAATCTLLTGEWTT